MTSPANEEALLEHGPEQEAAGDPVQAPDDELDDELDGPSDEDLEVLGARIGLAIASVVGAVLGAATAGGFWMCYPPARGVHWPIPTVGVVSAVLLITLYVTLRRRVGPAVADWFVVGYALALIGFASILTGGEAYDFVREHVVAVLGD
jgi:hypothetical protein